MGRLIDADALKRVLVVEWNLHDSDEFANKDVWKALELAPTVYPEPPKMGEWKWDGKGTTVVCSQCGKGYDWYTDAQYYDYCPHCGAYMGGKNGND